MGRRELWHQPWGDGHASISACIRGMKIFFFLKILVPIPLDCRKQSFIMPSKLSAESKLAFCEWTSIKKKCYIFGIPGVEVYQEGLTKLRECNQGWSIWVSEKEKTDVEGSYIVEIIMGIKSSFEAISA